MTTNSNSIVRRAGRTAAWLLLAGLVLALAAPVLGQEPAPEDGLPAPAVQVLRGRAEVGDNLIYLLPGLKAGQTVYVYAEAISGNLDPFVGLSAGALRSDTLDESFWALVNQVIEQGRDPVQALPEIYGTVLDAWDDDGGEGYDAALAYEVPIDGDYYLLMSRAPDRDTFGDYRLLVGLDEPAVLEKRGVPTGDVIAVFDEKASALKVKVERAEGELTAQMPEKSLLLGELRQGDILYVRVERVSGDLRPVLALLDFGGKLLRTDNLNGQADVAKLTYHLEEPGGSYAIKLVAAVDQGKLTSGSYRLLVGVNSPAVLSGDALPTGDALLQAPIEVRVGAKLQQITGVDQVAEKYGAVAQINMEWHDPALSFNPDQCDCTFQVMTLAELEKYAKDRGSYWPDFTVYNQQGNRWTQNRNIVVWSNGDVAYQERFTTDFQAPDFNFTKFPFDTQQLYIRVNSLYPERYYVYVAPEDMSGIGTQLGEEEWYITESSTEAGIEDGKAQFALGFQVKRHLTFYVFRIFVPIILVIIVSWFSFFLKDYGKRVDVAGANLLVFVAFNFTIAGELPRLGYLTVMDVVLSGTFIISALVVVFNVILKRLELGGRGELAVKIDAFSIWVYPLAYAVGGFLAYFLYLH